jgi:acetate kinase
MIEACARRCPRLPQVACFDTAFHAGMPRLAQLLPIPRRYEGAGLRRYGFHGLSYQFLMAELARVAGEAAARGRVVLAHLGAGASLAAVRGGRCIDTTMSFTPTSGMPMATRSGDLDPGVLLYLMREERMTAAQIDDLVNHRSGLLGVSDTSPDVRDLLARRAGDERATEAVALFCYQAKKWVGAFAAALGGLDTLVFAGGIGENAAPVRTAICDGLDFLGLHLDEARNAAGAEIISTATSSAVVRVMRTDEELVIARAVRRVLADPAAHGSGRTGS